MFAKRNERYNCLQYAAYTVRKRTGLHLPLKEYSLEYIVGTYKNAMCP